MTARVPAEVAWVLTQPPLAGRYEFQRLLGRGGVGAVVAVRDQELNRDVALKVLIEADDGDRARMIREGRLLARCRHPGIVQVYAVEEVDEHVVLVLELITGRTLAAVLDDMRPLPVRRACELTAALLDCLAAAHELGLIHRDVKPDNVILLDSGEIKLLDFGLARPLELDTDSRSRLTVTGQVAGTPVYMAPEQCLGQPLTPAADIYSVGITLYELTVGQRPFEGSLFQVMEGQLYNPPPDPRLIQPDLPLALVAILARALSKLAIDRFASAAEMAAALRALVVDIDLGTAAVSGPQTLAIAKAEAMRIAARSPREARRAGLDALGQGAAGEARPHTAWAGLDGQLHVVPAGPAQGATASGGAHPGPAAATRNGSTRDGTPRGSVARHLARALTALAIVAACLALTAVLLRGPATPPPEPSPTASTSAPPQRLPTVAHAVHRVSHFQRLISAGYQNSCVQLATDARAPLFAWTRIPGQTAWTAGPESPPALVHCLVVNWPGGAEKRELKVTAIRDRDAPALIVFQDSRMKHEQVERLRDLERQTRVFEFSQVHDDDACEPRLDMAALLARPDPIAQVHAQVLKRLSNRPFEDCKRQIVDHLELLLRRGDVDVDNTLQALGSVTRVHMRRVVEILLEANQRVVDRPHVSWLLGVYAAADDDVRDLLAASLRTSPHRDTIALALWRSQRPERLSLLDPYLDDGGDRAQKAAYLLRESDPDIADVLAARVAADPRWAEALACPEVLDLVALRRDRALARELFERRLSLASPALDARLVWAVGNAAPDTRTLDRLQALARSSGAVGDMAALVLARRGLPLDPPPAPPTARRAVALGLSGQQRVPTLAAWAADAKLAPGIRAAALFGLGAAGAWKTRSTLIEASKRESPFLAHAVEQVGTWLDTRATNEIVVLGAGLERVPTGNVSRGDLRLVVQAWGWGAPTRLAMWTTAYSVYQIQPPKLPSFADEMGELVLGFPRDPLPKLDDDTLVWASSGVEHD